MAGKALDIASVMLPDRMGTEIANTWHQWNMYRASKIEDWTEIRKYIFATNTKQTTNAKLPWKNTTTIPKLCQIRDNLHSNYMAAIFPKRKWLLWDADDQSSGTKAKKDAITGYMCYAIGQKNFKSEVSKCILDYIDYGNAFAMPVWVDQRVEVIKKGSLQKTQVGYVGPALRRISPLDIVMNPIAPSFDESPKIVRDLVSLADVRKLLDGLSNDDNRESYQELWAYLIKYRSDLLGFGGDLTAKDTYLSVDGYTNYRLYLESNFCEILTFYGDLYDSDTKKMLQNQVIMVADRHKVISQQANPSIFGASPIYHIGWRKRQDNLWAMGPLDNLVGMQYRIDHIENLKADVFDLIAFPPLKIKGFVEDFEWGPMARIHTDEEGDVAMVAPEWNVLTANVDVQYLLGMMEEMAGAPKEAMGFRTPGEKTKYEVQRQENAASRIFQSKTSQFEEQFLEESLNGMLELAKRKADSNILAKYFDDEFKITTFLELTPDDITGEGRIRPYAARHFAEQAELVQNLTNFFGSPIGQDPGMRAHWSTIKMAKLFEDLFDITDYSIVRPYVRMAEEADAQRLANAIQEQVLTEAMTASGLTEDDITNPQAQPGGGPAAPGLPPQVGAMAPPGVTSPPPGAGLPQAPMKGIRPPASSFQTGPGFPTAMGQPQQPLATR